MPVQCTVQARWVHWGAVSLYSKCLGSRPSCGAHGLSCAISWCPWFAFPLDRWSATKRLHYFWITAGTFPLLLCCYIGYFYTGPRSQQGDREFSVTYQYNTICRRKAFSFGPRGAGIRRLTGRQKIQGNQYQKERLIRYTGQSGHGSGDSGPKAFSDLRPFLVMLWMYYTARLPGAPCYCSTHCWCWCYVHSTGSKRPAKRPLRAICLGGWVVFDRSPKEKRQFFFTPVKGGFIMLNTNCDIQLYSAVISLQFTLKKGRILFDIIGYWTTSNRHHELPKGRLRQLPIRY